MQAERRLPSALLNLVWVAVCGALAVLLAQVGLRRESRPNEPGLHRDVFQVARPEGRPVVVTPDNWRPIPLLFADFDLVCELELSPGAELDVLIRRVEPRPVQGVALPFQGRFEVLRLRGEAPQQDEDPAHGWLHRDEALFGDGRGLSVEPGVRATVWIQGRGSRLTANVAGVTLPAVMAVDDHGSFAFAVRNGRALLHNLTITPVAGDGWGLAWWWGGLVGLGLGLLARLLGVRPTTLWALAPLLPIGALLGRSVAFARLLPLTVPDPISIALAAFCLAPLLLVDWLPGRGRWQVRVLLLLPMALGAVVLLLEAAVRGEDARAADREHPAVDLVFGPAAGEGLADALAGRVHGALEVHATGGERPVVFLLGGQLLWAATADPQLHGEVQLKVALHERGRAVDVIASPTVDGHAHQQWLWFDLFGWGFRPKVVVFGVGADEAVAVPGGDAAARLGASAEWREHRLVLGPFAAPRGWIGRQGPGPEGPRSTPVGLRAILRRVRADCAEKGVALVLAAGPGLSADLLGELRTVAADGVPLLEIQGGEEPAAWAGRLAGLVAPALGR